MKRVANDEILYHIGFSTSMIEQATQAILLDNGNDVKALAFAMDPNAKFISENREYITYLVAVEGVKTVLVSTGYGAPPLGIGLEEMAMVGLSTFIRVGEAGAIAKTVKVGDFVILKGALRREGTSKHYAPLNYPAAADFTLTQALLNSAKQCDLTYHSGLGVTVDGPWPTTATHHEGDQLFQEKNKALLDKWQRERLLCVDNAVATLFVMGSVFGLRTCAVLDVTYSHHEGGVFSHEKLSEKSRYQHYATLLKGCLKEIQ